MKTAEHEDLYKQWLAEHTGLMFKVVRAFAAGAEDRDDLFQEILLQVWISVPAFREKAKPSTWIYRVALNTALNWHRGENKCRQSHTLLADVRGRADAKNCGANVLEQEELLERLYGEIRKLRKIDCSLILMYLDGLTYREMADVLGISESSVGVRINRIKKQLAESMKGGANGL